MNRTARTLAATVAAAALLSACGATTAQSAPASAPATPTADNLRAYSSRLLDAMADLDVAGMVKATAGDTCPLSTLTAAQGVAELKSLNLDHDKIVAAYSAATVVKVNGVHGTISGTTLTGQSTTAFTWTSRAWHRAMPADGC